MTKKELSGKRNMYCTQRIQPDRSLLQTLTQPVSEFTESLIEKLQHHSNHHTRAKNQSKFLKYVKLNLE
jgi:hypothetical protein